MLLRLRFWLLTATVLVFAGAVAALTGTYGTAETVKDRTSQAQLEVASARANLVDANAAAVRSFHSGEAALAGPGEDHLRSAALAGQSLARLAEVNVAGEPGTRTLHVIEGLLASYRGAIGQADAHFRQEQNRQGAPILGVTDLWYASRLLHQPDGALDQLARLGVEQRAALDTQLSSGFLHPATIPLWTVPIAALLALLIVTQVYLARRFRRTLNLPLLAATAGLLAVAIGMAFTLGSQGELRQTRDTLDRVVAESRAQTDARDADGRRALAALVGSVCGPHCGETVTSVAAAAPAPAKNSEANDKKISEGAKQANVVAADAADPAGRQWWIPALILAIAGLVLLGLQSRIDDYRYSET